MTALDTNILIYACDKSDPKRRARALDLIASATDGVLLWQVACEFIAASRKLAPQGFAATDAWTLLREFLNAFPLVLPTDNVLERARGLQLDHHVSFWDAMILAACLEAGIELLYSEDVPGLDTVGPLKVINPFI